MSSKSITITILACFLFGCASGIKLEQPRLMNINLEINSDAKLIGADKAPKYPKQPLRKGVSGYVDVIFVVDTTGFSDSINIIKEEPQGYGFGLAVKDRVRNLRFIPAVHNKKIIRQKFKRRYYFNCN